MDNPQTGELAMSMGLNQEAWKSKRGEKP